MGHPGRARPADRRRRAVAGREGTPDTDRRDIRAGDHRHTGGAQQSPQRRSPAEVPARRPDRLRHLRQRLYEPATRPTGLPRALPARHLRQRPHGPAHGDRDARPRRPKAEAAGTGQDRRRGARFLRGDQSPQPRRHRRRDREDRRPCSRPRRRSPRSSPRSRTAASARP